MGTALSPPGLRRITLGGDVVEIDIRRNEKAVLITSDGIRHSLKLMDWGIEENSIRVDLGADAGFILHPGIEEPGFRLEPIIPKTLPPVQTLEIPFRLGDNARVSNDPNHPDILTITVSDDTYAAKLPSGTTWDTSAERLKLVVLENPNPVFELIGDWQGKRIHALEWQQSGAAPSGEIYQETIDQWMEEARKGWKSRLGGGGSAGWSDLLAAALLADSVKNGSFPANYRNVLSAANRAPGNAGWLSSPYLGNIVNQSRQHALEMRRVTSTSATIPSYTSSGLTFLLDSGNINGAKQLVASALTLPDIPPPNKEIINRIVLLHEAGELGIRTLDAAFITRLFREFLLPQIYWMNEGLWLLEADDSVDAKLSLIAGQLLLEQADFTNDAIYRAIGQQMIISVLTHTGEGGMVPETLHLQRGGEVIRTGWMNPEEFYPLIISAPAYPRHISLTRELKPGAWALTGAENFTLSSTAGETRITVNFPAGALPSHRDKGTQEFQRSVYDRCRVER